MVIIETSVFTRQIQQLMTDDQYHRLQTVLLIRPDLGAIVPGSGGLRKLRWAASGRGKRGGARLIYYWAVRQEQILLLFIYPKNVQDDLTPGQLRALRMIVETEYL